MIQKAQAYNDNMAEARILNDILTKIFQSDEQGKKQLFCEVSKEYINDIAWKLRSLNYKVTDVINAIKVVW